ncbi:MAG: fibronectin type III-like domain-contianing protein [Alistipes shahii]
MKGFRKVFLRKGETKRVTLRLKDDAFAFYDSLQGEIHRRTGRVHHLGRLLLGRPAASDTDRARITNKTQPVSG